MKSMNIAFFVLLSAVLLLPACKSKKMTAVEPRTPPVQEIEQEPVATGQQMSDIPVRTERFTFERQDQAVAHTYFIIVGSYSNPNNAERARTILSNQGFTAIILKSETGLNRLSVNSYTNESEARSRVQQIRSSYPEYHDAWLLIRQQ